MPPPWLTAARRIAVVRFDRLGDVVLGLPMFRALREQLPATELHLVCQPYTAPAADGVTCVDRVHTLPPSGPARDLGMLFRQERFDVVFFPRHVPRHAWAAIRAGVRHRVGTGRKPLSLLYNHWVFSRRSWRSGKHAAVLDVDMAAAVMGRQLETRLVPPPLAPAAVESLHRKLARAGFSRGTPLLVVHPGSGGSAPGWSPEGFAQVAAELAREHGWAVAVTGVAGEEALVQRVVRNCPGAVSLAGQLDLPELFPLIAGARLVLTNCTGPMHVAAAFDTPVVGALTGADVARWRPLSTRGGWVASAPGARTLDGVTVERFVTEGRRVLAIPAPVPQALQQA